MTQPNRVDTRPTNPLDGPFIGCGTLMLTGLLLPCLWWVAVRLANPVDARAVYVQGAVDMCLSLADSANAPRAQSEPACASFAAELE
jgi:hypothetical protein